jgi:hypothetical protein
VDRSFLPFQHSHRQPGKQVVTMTTIDDGLQEIRDVLMQNLLGVWDYIKNSGEFPQAGTVATATTSLTFFAANMSLDWIEWKTCKREAR